MTGALYESVYYGLSMSFQETKIIFNQQNPRDFPEKLKVVDWLKEDLTSLLKLLNRVIPPKRLARVKYVCNTQYGFGDTPGSDFGSSWKDQGREKKYCKRTWRNNMDVKSSNLR